jgi:hypothetical protein
MVAVINALLRGRDDDDDDDGDDLERTMFEERLKGASAAK